MRASEGDRHVRRVLGPRRRHRSARCRGDVRSDGRGGSQFRCRRPRRSQLPQRGVRADLLSDGVSQGALPPRVHGRAPLARDGRDRQDLQEHRRVPCAPHLVRFGLGAVKGVGSKAIEIMLAARREGGPFTDLADFANRVRGQQINRRVVECLIKCGTFDSLGVSRAALLTEPEPGAPAYLDKVLQWASTAAESAGQITLFALRSVPPPRPPTGIVEWSDKERLAAEKETVGFYITGHPLDRFDRDLRRLTTAPIAELGTRVTRDREKVKVGGVVHTLKLKNNKKGDRYATFNLEDKSGTIEVLVWPEAYRRRGRRPRRRPPASRTRAPPAPRRGGPDGRARRRAGAHARGASGQLHGVDRGAGGGLRRERAAPALSGRGIGSPRRRGGAAFRRPCRLPVVTGPGPICFAILRCSVAGMLAVALLRLRSRLPRASSRSQLDPGPRISFIT
ncbi:MAG: hypothetical protein E6J72_09450 [Deltaproteobacteria bacterium]|nr:MAG: hypothetical protein E6J72_09450 [Deltaproteobacteria bacterium]